MIDKELVKSRFEKSIETYDKTAIVQKKMAEELTENICEYCGTDFQDIFEFGSGTGFLTNCINKNIKYKSYTANDIVEKSEKFIKEIIPTCKFIPGDIESIDIDAQFDLILSNASMQWIGNLDDLLLKFKKMLKPEGYFAFTTFGDQNFSEIKETTGLALNYLKTETFIQKIEKYFTISFIEERTTTILFDTPFDILKHIKNSGTNGIQTINWTVKKLRDFERYYSLRFSKNGKVRLTYNPIFVILIHK